MSDENNQGLASATLGAGCFWCVEAVFQQLQGVKKVDAGYAGGETENPTYEEVCMGNSGHAEVARIDYDPEVITFEELLEVFWHTHNPTTLNRQGADVGTQYRSAIFYHDEEQKAIAERSLKQADESGLWGDRIVTKIEPLKNFAKAEGYHQNYYEKHKNGPYCDAVIEPKLRKLKEKFGEKLKMAV
jgi:peptide-methionine (S)-S-oxide reductase